ncbi:MAG: MlaD family protein [Desulfobacterales bacterium]|jgi:hypothetical protein
MTNDKPDESMLNEVPEAEILSRRRSFSIVWLVPLVAVIIGGWLVYKAQSEKGPTITITFKTAEGLEAGKTKIKYKDVELGQVSAIKLRDDLSKKPRPFFQKIRGSGWFVPGWVSAGFPVSAPFSPVHLLRWIPENTAKKLVISQDWKYRRL